MTTAQGLVIPGHIREPSWVPESSDFRRFGFDLALFVEFALAGYCLFLPEIDTKIVGVTSCALLQSYRLARGDMRSDLPISLISLHLETSLEVLWEREAKATEPSVLM